MLCGDVYVLVCAHLQVGPVLQGPEEHVPPEELLEAGPACG